MKKAIDPPILAYKADGEINQVIWSTLQYDWVAIGYGDKVQALHV